MTTEAIIAALADIHRATSLLDPDNFLYGADGKHSYLAQIDMMRCLLRDEGPDAFTSYTQRMLGANPDRTINIMEDLYSKLGLDPERTMWDEFAQLLDDAQALTREQRADMAREITEAMRKAYEAEGETGTDFEDGERYLRDDASDSELLEEQKKWIKPA